MKKNSLSIMTCLVCLVALICLGLPRTASAITVANPSFETPVSPPASDTTESNISSTPPATALAPGWSCTKSGPGGSSSFGTSKPRVSFYGSLRPLPAPFDGNQFGYVNVFGTRGTDWGEAVSAPVGTLTAGHTLTLKVAVGVRNTVAWVADYKIGLELLNGTDLGTTATATVTPTATVGAITDMTYTLNVSAEAAAYVGQPYRIFIRGTSAGQLNFDNVRLTDPDDTLVAALGNYNLQAVTNTSVTTPLAVTNTGTGPLTLTAVNVSNGTPYSVSSAMTPAVTLPKTLAAGETTTFTLRFAPIARGTFPTTITLLSDVGTAHNSATVSASGWSFEYEPTFIRDVITSATVTDAQRTSAKATDNSGILDADNLIGSKTATASTFGGNDFWGANPSDAAGGPVAATIFFDLKRTYSIYQMLVWNCNDENQLLRATPGTNDYSERGMKLAVVSYKTNWNDAWTTLGTFTFVKATGGIGSGVNGNVFFGNINARYVSIRPAGGRGVGNYTGVTRNENYVGLGEVRFYTAPPNPVKSWSVFE